MVVRGSVSAVRGPPATELHRPTDREPHTFREVKTIIRDHIRSNIVGYVALFVALGGGTAFAADTVFSEDIVDGQVKTNDISNSNGVRSADVRDDTAAGGGLAAVDLAPDSVAGSEIAADAVDFGELAPDSVRNFEIAAAEVRGSEIAENAVGSGEIVTAGVGSAEIATDGVGSAEIATDGVGSAEVATGAVGSQEIAANAVGGAEVATQSIGGDDLRFVIERRSQLVFVNDGTAHDGAYGIGSATVSCNADEVMLNVSLDWLNDADHNETALADEEIEYFAEEHTATVAGAFDGGDTASFQAVAACL